MVVSNGLSNTVEIFVGIDCICRIILTSPRALVYGNSITFSWTPFCSPTVTFFLCPRLTCYDRIKKDLKHFFSVKMKIKKVHKIIYHHFSSCIAEEDGHLSKIGRFFFVLEIADDSKITFSSITVPIYKGNICYVKLLKNKM